MSVSPEGGGVEDAMSLFRVNGLVLFLPSKSQCKKEMNERMAKEANRQL